MVAPLIGAAARMGAKKLAEKGGKKSAEELAREGSYRAAREAAEKKAKQDDLYKKAAIGVGTVAALPIAGGAGRDMAEDFEKAKQIKKEKTEAKDEMKRETRGMKKGGVVKSSASKRADGIAQRGKTKGRMV
jgi:hypothetical protein